jgi:polar amino acid transport system substrate-binding protein
VIYTDSIEDSFDMFVANGLEALAGLRPRLLDDSERLPGSRLLDGRFTAVRQAIGIRRDREGAGLPYLEQFVDWALGSGLVADLIECHDVIGLSVPAPRGR